MYKWVWRTTACTTVMRDALAEVVPARASRSQWCASGNGGAPFHDKAQSRGLRFVTRERARAANGRASPGAFTMEAVQKRDSAPPLL